MDAFFIFSAQYLFILPTLILGTYFLTRKWPAQKRTALFAIPAGLVTYLLALMGNYLHFVPRPFVVGHFTPLIAHSAENGFPSDPTVLVAPLAAVGMYWNAWLRAVLWTIALLVAISRVYVGLRHPIDVLATIAFAIIGVSVPYRMVGIQKSFEEIAKRLVFEARLWFNGIFAPPENIAGSGAFFISTRGALN